MNNARIGKCKECKMYGMSSARNGQCKEWIIQGMDYTRNGKCKDEKLQGMENARNENPGNGHYKKMQGMDTARNGDCKDFFYFCFVSVLMKMYKFQFLHLSKEGKNHVCLPVW